MIKFTIPGPPQGKARARTGKGFAYTPENTVVYENLIKIMFLQTKAEMTEKPVKITINAYYPIPKSATKGKRLAMEYNIIRPTKKPDADNVFKVVADGLNGLAYKDDTQIVEAKIYKWHSTEPRVEVEIEELREGLE